MMDVKPDLESLKKRRSNAQRTFTTRINRLNVRAGHLREIDLAEELTRMREDYSSLLDASNDYIDAQGQIDPTGEDTELQDAMAKRDTSLEKFLEFEDNIMGMLWSKYAEPDMNAIVTQFKSMLDRAEELGKDKVVPWGRSQ